MKVFDSFTALGPGNQVSVRVRDPGGRTGLTQRLMNRKSVDNVALGLRSAKNLELFDARPIYPAVVLGHAAAKHGKSAFQIGGDEATRKDRQGDLAGANLLCLFEDMLEKPANSAAADLVRRTQADDQDIPDLFVSGREQKTVTPMSLKMGFAQFLRYAAAEDDVKAGRTATEDGVFQFGQNQEIRVDPIDSFGRAVEDR